MAPEVGTRDLDTNLNIPRFLSKEPRLRGVEE